MAEVEAVAGYVPSDEVSCSLEQENRACRDLWASILDRALKDACGTNGDMHEIAEHFGFHLRDYRKFSKQFLEALRAEYREYLMVEALAWFESNKRAPGSFLWICDQLDFDADAIRIGAKALIETKSPGLVH